MRQPRRMNKAEPTTALINVVFLILIFFMVSGSLNRPANGGIEFVETSDLECCTTPDALMVSAQGELFSDSGPVEDLSAFIAQQAGPDITLRLLPDRNLPAFKLLQLVNRLKETGSDRVIIMTENTPS